VDTEIEMVQVRVVGKKVGRGAVEAKRLQVGLCMWLASQLYPEMYGDKA
jgi:hypothetical protein